MKYTIFIFCITNIPKFHKTFTEYVKRNTTYVFWRENNERTYQSAADSNIVLSQKNVFFLLFISFFFLLAII